MKFSLNSTFTLIVASVSSALLPGCGGGAQSGSASAAVAPASSSVTADAAASATTLTAGTTTLGSLAALIAPASLTPMAEADIITDVKLESTAASGAAQSNVPFTFGQVFARGDLLPSNTLIGKLTDGTVVPLQMDVKATHPDGSVRHAVVSAILPSLAVGDLRTLNIGKKAALSTVPAPTTPASILASGFTSSVNLKLNNQTYSASADDLLKTTPYKTWLAGTVANEWLVWAPLKTAAGAVHPHLTARFAIRWYSAVKKARVDVTIENNWTYVQGPQNYTYDAQVMVGGQKVYDKPALTHIQHTRWRKMFWWGETPQVHIRHNTKYLIDSRAVPNYDQSVVIAEDALAYLKNNWTGSSIEPMGLGVALAYMPTTGGRRDIGLLPAWSAMYLLSMDKRAKEVMLGTADLAGSFSTHYRNERTDRPVSLVDYPYMTRLGRQTDTFNPQTGKYESFPECGTVGQCETPYEPDTSHQPAFAYLPYLVTGDYYYLEELQFWTMWNLMNDNPNYRENVKGLLHPDQVRGQAWSLRTLAEAAYITPDADSMKAQLNTFLSTNLDWYNTNYTNNSSANALGVITNGYAYSYSGYTGIAPWQDDFFTAAVGHISELGFTKATPLLAWKSKFSIDRMVGAGACWIDGSIYSVIIRDTPTSPVYTSISQVYKVNHVPEFSALGCNSPEMAASLGLRIGEMNNYSSSAVGFPSNMQPALAYSADAGGKRGADAWSLFMSRSVKPNYAGEPEWAIIPR
jgi:hypothetical protein